MEKLTPESFNDGLHTFRDIQAYINQHLELTDNLARVDFGDNVDIQVKPNTFFTAVCSCCGKKIQTTVGDYLTHLQTTDQFCIHESCENNPKISKVSRGSVTKQKPLVVKTEEDKQDVEEKVSSGKFDLENVKDINKVLTKTLGYKPFTNLSFKHQKNKIKIGTKCALCGSNQSYKSEESFRKIVDLTVGDNLSQREVQIHNCKNCIAVIKEHGINLAFFTNNVSSIDLSKYSDVYNRVGELIDEGILSIQFVEYALITGNIYDPSGEEIKVNVSINIADATVDKGEFPISLLLYPSEGRNEFFKLVIETITEMEATAKLVEGLSDEEDQQISEALSIVDTVEDEPEEEEVVEDEPEEEVVEDESEEETVKDEPIIDNETISVESLGNPYTVDVDDSDDEEEVLDDEETEDDFVDVSTDTEDEVEPEESTDDDSEEQTEIENDNSPDVDEETYDDEFEDLDEPVVADEVEEPIDAYSDPVEEDDLNKPREKREKSIGDISADIESSDIIFNPITKQFINEYGDIVLSTGEVLKIANDPYQFLAHGDSANYMDGVDPNDCKIEDDKVAVVDDTPTETVESTIQLEDSPYADDLEEQPEPQKKPTYKSIYESAKDEYKGTPLEKEVEEELKFRSKRILNFGVSKDKMKTGLLKKSAEGYLNDFKSSPFLGFTNTLVSEYRALFKDSPKIDDNNKPVGVHADLRYNLETGEIPLIEFDCGIRIVLLDTDDPSVGDIPHDYYTAANAKCGFLFKDNMIGPQKGTVETYYCYSDDITSNGTRGSRAVIAAYMKILKVRAGKWEDDNVIRLSNYETVTYTTDAAKVLEFDNYARGTSALIPFSDRIAIIVKDKVADDTELDENEKYMRNYRMMSRGLQIEDMNLFIPITAKYYQHKSRNRMLGSIDIITITEYNEHPNVVIRDGLTYVIRAILKEYMMTHKGKIPHIILDFNRAVPMSPSIQMYALDGKISFKQGQMFDPRPQGFHKTLIKEPDARSIKRDYKRLDYRLLTSRTITSMFKSELMSGQYQNHIRDEQGINRFLRSISFLTLAQPKIFPGKIDLSFVMSQYKKAFTFQSIDVGLFAGGQSRRLANSDMPENSWKTAFLRQGMGGTQNIYDSLINNKISNKNIDTKSVMTQMMMSKMLNK